MTDQSPTDSKLKPDHVPPDKQTADRQIPDVPLWVTLLVLMRIPNVFSAFADILMGFIFIHQAFQPIPGLAMLLATTFCLYSAGMVLNDVFDYRVDSTERPYRPIPAGLITLAGARSFGVLLLVCGVILSAAASWVAAPQAPLSGIPFLPVWVALGLVTMILLYDGVLKKTPVAPLAMGGCRFLNVLLGMSLAGAEHQDLVPSGLMLAGGMGIFVAGITWFARTEARESNRMLLAFGLAVMILGLALIASTPFTGWALPPTVRPNTPYLLPFIILLIGLSIFRLGAQAILDPIPQHVQLTIRQSLLSLILINAAICLWIDSHQIMFAFSVVVLIFPAILLGRWFHST